LRAAPLDYVPSRGEFTGWASPALCSGLQDAQKNKLKQGKSK